MGKRFLVVCAALACAFAYGCNCGHGNGGGGGGSGGSGGSSGGGSGTGGGSAGGSGTGGGTGGVCAPACVAPQFCGALNHCLDGGTCQVNEDCQMGEVCDPDGGTCVPGSQCGSTQVNGGNVSPNLIIALDRSCSMTNKVGTKTKWQIAYEALTQLTTTYQGKIRFGLTFFPDTVAPNCTQGAIPIPIGDNNEPVIQARLLADQDAGNPEYPKGPCVTPIDTGVEQAATDPGLMDPLHPGFILLITDGMQAGCSAGGGNPGTTAAITTARQQHGVDTFVVGFDNSGGIDVASLNAFADAGGQPAPKLPDGGGYLFFNAQDQASLQAALDLIGGRTLGCNYALTTTPPDPNKLFVFFDKMQVVRDPTHASGWDYNPITNLVTFYGASCDELKNGQVAKLDIVYGCPNPPIN